VIQPALTPEAQEAAAQQPATGAQNPAPKPKPERSFSAVLDGEKRVHDDAATKRARSKTKVEFPEGEEWRPVRGDDNYGRITNGPRKGMFINLSDGARRGEVFRVEHRHGKRVHVYGEGENQKVIPASRDSGKVDGHHHHLRRGEMAHTAHPSRNEKWAPVEGHSDYVDIISGRRNGYFLNTSGGERDGMVFHIVHRHGREYHVYGRGKNKQVVLVDHGDHKARKHDKPDKPDKPNKSDGTGGASPS